MPIGGDLALYVAWPVGDRDGRALRLGLRHACADLPGGIAGRRLVNLLLDAEAPPAAAVQALLAEVARHLEIAADLEATLSLDPRALDPRDLAAYHAAGVNRLSLGAGVLDEAAQAALAAAAALFSRCAVDLAFGRPGQTLAAWRAELDRAVRLGAGHVSLEEHAGEAADSDRSAAFYELALERLSAAGLPPYEIAHCARPGQESRQLLHGAGGGDYFGIGPGAAGRVTVGSVCHALRQIALEAAWLRAVEAGAETLRRELHPAERRTELLLAGLRLRTGIARASFEPLGGPLEAAFDAEKLAALVEDGFLALDRQGLRLTRRGWPLCDAVLARLLH